MRRAILFNSISIQSVQYNCKENYYQIQSLYSQFSISPIHFLNTLRYANLTVGAYSEMVSDSNVPLLGKAHKKITISDKQNIFAHNKTLCLINDLADKDLLHCVVQVTGSFQNEGKIILEHNVHHENHPSQ